ncbi:MAG: hypothetical protein KC418_24010 [Anaerolineales bacterium]|nr:hypothetical protein [Anaerolineales bacterium]
MNDNDEVKRTYTLVWRFRALMEEAASPWVTPEPLDALRFAATEVAEAMDAWLRARGGFARNSDRHEQVLSELADCAIMLATSIPDYSFSGGEAYGQHTLDGLIYLVACVLQTAALGGPFQFRAAAAMCAIAAYDGMALEREVRDRLVRIMLRHTNEDDRADLAWLLAEG